jgi:hypothetical protein
MISALLCYILYCVTLPEMQRILIASKMSLPATDLALSDLSAELLIGALQHAPETAIDHLA